MQTKTRSTPKILLATALAFALSACGGGGGGSDPVTEVVQDPPSKPCATSDEENTNPECGTVYIDVTDADGDFQTYSVDLVSLSLTRQDGVVVEVLPASSRIDFAAYTELSELVTAATIPNGVYVSGEVTLDYSAAEVLIENNAALEPAEIVDDTGNPVEQVTLAINLDNRSRLTIAPGIPALLEIDFDLEASHVVDLGALPITATLGPVLTAEVDPVETKELRIRGPLIRVDQASDYYRIALRPFYHRNVRFGGVNVQVDSNTLYEIDGVEYSGEAGLTALAAMQPTTATVAFGSLDVAEREYTAQVVYAGSSVPGGTLDAAHGHIIARSDNSLTLKGATLVRTDGEVSFREEITVTVGAQTRVRNRFSPDPASSVDISVGQRVSVLGEFAEPEQQNPDGEGALAELNAEQGSVRLLLTRMNGTLNSFDGTQINLALQGIDRRNPLVFDFSGTGATADTDADPQDYQAWLNGLSPTLNSGAPLRLTGYVNGFGEAPHDFNALSVADFSSSRAKLAVNWLGAGTAAPFSILSDSVIEVDLNNADLGELAQLRRGGIISGLSELAMPVMTVPDDSSRALLSIREGDSLTLHTTFAGFTGDVAARLSAGKLVSRFYARGGFASDTGELTTRRMVIVIKPGADNP